MCFLTLSINLLIFNLVALLKLSAGCSKNDDGPKYPDSGVVGEWHLTEWIDGTHSEFDVYIEFLSDGKFNSYEKVKTLVYVRRSGNFTIDGTRLLGRYSSGKPWKTDYAFELSDDGKTLTMISDTGIAEVSIYMRSAISEAMRNEPEVRSAPPRRIPVILRFGHPEKRRPIGRTAFRIRRCSSIAQGTP